MNNFHKDQIGMHSQLKQVANLIKYLDPQLHRHLDKHNSTNMFFCFRWLLILFKREFELDDVEHIWDVSQFLQLELDNCLLTNFLFCFNLFLIVMCRFSFLITIRHCTICFIVWP